MVKPPIAVPEEVATLPRNELEQACRESVMSVGVGPDTAICRVLTRYKVYVDTADVGIAPHLIMEGFWESWITQSIARLVRPGFRCLDLGANFGYYTLLMAECAGHDGRVLAVEANPKVAGLLRQTMAANGFANRVQVVERAVTDHSGDHIGFSWRDDSVGGGGISGDELEGWRHADVETVTVDELVQDWDRVDFAKIDIESSEYLAWAGMQQTIERNPAMALCVEVSAAYDTYDLEAFLEDIQSAGFPLRRIDESGNITAIDPAACVERTRNDWVMLYLQRPQR